MKTINQPFKKSNSPRLVQFLLVLTLAIQGLHGQDIVVREFPLKNAQKDAHSGWDVSLTENWAFIASPNFTVKDLDAAGKIDVYRRAETEWHYFGEIISPEPADHEYFGFSITAKGDELVVGAIGNNKIEYMAGCIYYYSFDGKKWVNVQQLIPDGLTSGAELGFDVDIDTNHILAGAPFGNGSFSNTGAAYLYVKENGKFSLQKKLLNKIDNYHSGFGTRVALGNNLAFIGTVYHNQDGTKTGTVLSFKKEGKNRKEIQVFSPETTSKCDCFGSSLIVEDDLLIIGARNGDSDIKDHGYVSCYKWNGERYDFLQKFHAPVKEKNGMFGVSLAMIDKHLFVGATGSEVDGHKDAGRVQVYHFENDKFVHVRDISGIFTEKQGQFGSSLAVNRESFLVGSWGADKDEKDAGIAHLVRIPQLVAGKSGLDNVGGR